LREKLVEYLEFREAIKKPMKPASQLAFTRRLQKMSGMNPTEAIEILETSIANGWQGIFPVKNSTLSLQKK
jgi:hypothetical protein